MILSIGSRKWFTAAAAICFQKTNLELYHWRAAYWNFVRLKPYVKLELRLGRSGWFHK